MNPRLQQLRQLGQSLWLDNITRDLLDSGTLARYIQDYGLTGLTSNPTIFDEAIGNSDAYDAAIRARQAQVLPSDLRDQIVAKSARELARRLAAADHY